MSPKRLVLEQLRQEELLSVLDGLGLEVRDCKSRDELVEVLAGSHKAGLADLLDGLPPERLKEICGALGLNESVCVDRPSFVAYLSGQGQITSEILDRHLWAALEILRNSIGSDNKNYLLVLFALKRLSDRFEEERELVRAEGGEPEDPVEYEVFVPAIARWERLLRISKNFGDELNRAIAALEGRNPNLEGVLRGIDFNDPGKLGDTLQRDRVLGRLVSHFSNIDLRNANLSDPDILGRAFDYLVERFAEDSGSRGGQFFTPRRLVRLIVEILQPREGLLICDPACGSGGMLIECARHIERNGGNPRNLGLFGQERNSGFWTICKLNLLLHGLSDARIETGDTIREPKFVENGKLMLFDFVLSNPPASLGAWGWELAETDPWSRFQFGIPPKGNGDYAFLQHMLASLAPQGRMATLVPQSVLFRSGSETEIRRALVESDLIEAIISLPSGILLHTNVPPAIIVCSRAKPSERKQHILFVDASKKPTRAPRSWQPLEPAHLDHLAAVVHEFREEEDFSKVATFDEVIDRSFNLKPGLYIDQPSSGERLDHIAEVLQGRGRPRHHTSDEVPVIQGRDLGVRGLAKEDLAHWSVPSSLSRSVFVREGDVLIQRIGLKPKAMLAGRSLNGAFASDTIFIIRLRDEYRMNGLYLADFLNSPVGQRQIANSIDSAVIPTLSLKVLRGLRVPLPDPGLSDLLERVRSLEDDLLERIQKTLTIRSKLFSSHDPSTLEAEVRRLSIEAELLRESVARSEDLDFQIRNFYPHMVAYGYRRLSSIFDPEKRYRQQLSLLDTLLIFLGSVGLMLATSVASAGELSAAGLARNELLEMWRSGASLGRWVGICRSAAKVLKVKPGSPAGRAFATIWSSRIERTSSALLQMRNKDAHRRRQRSRREAEEASAEFEGLFQEVLRESRFFVQHPIRLVESVSVHWKSTGAVHNTLVYSGDHPSLRREAVHYREALPEGHLYLELEAGSWLSLYPLLNVEEFGGERQTYAIDRFEKERRRAGLHGLESGQEASQEHSRRVGEDFMVWLNDIFGPDAVEA